MGEKMIAVAWDFSVFLIFSILQIVWTNDLNAHSSNLSDISSPLGLLIGNKFTNDSAVNIPPVVSPNHNPHAVLPQTDSAKSFTQRARNAVEMTSYLMNKLTTNQQEYTVYPKQRNISISSEENSNSSSSSSKNITSSTKVTTSLSSPSSTFSSKSTTNLPRTKAIITKVDDLTTTNIIKKTRPVENTNLLNSSRTKFMPSKTSKMTTSTQRSVTKSSESSAFADIKSTTIVVLPLLTEAEQKPTTITSKQTTHVQTTNVVRKSTSNRSTSDSSTTDADIKPSKFIDNNESMESTITDGSSIQTSINTVKPLSKETKDIRKTTQPVRKTSVEHYITTKSTAILTSSNADYSKTVSTNQNTDPTSPISIEERTEDLDPSPKSDSDKYWPVAIAITIGVPAVIVIGVTISVINRKRNLEKAHSTLLNGYITPPSEYEA